MSFVRARPYVIFVLLVALGAGVAFAVSAGYYPIALVGHDMLTAHEFAKNYGAAARYYRNLLRVYGSTSTVAEAGAPRGLEEFVLNALVEKNLVHDEAAKETGKDFAYLVDQKISELQSDHELGAAALAIYGLTAPDFRSEILVPQAEREILAGRLFLKGETLADWLKRAKESSHVVIFSPEFRWDGNQVQRVGGGG